MKKLRFLINFNKKNRTLRYLVFFRVINSLLLSTLFEPDEFFQNIDIVYKIILNNNHLTWDWVYGIRSFCFPLLYFLPAFVLKKIFIFIFKENWKPKFVSCNFFVVKILNGIFSGLCDFCTIRIAENFKINKYHTIFVTLTSHILYLYSARSHVNSAEMWFSVFSIYFLIRYNKNKKISTLIFCYILITYSFYMRQSSCIIIFPFFLQNILSPTNFYLLTGKNGIFIKILIFLLVSLITLFSLIYIDTLLYCENIIPPLNFYIINVKHKISEFFSHQDLMFYFSVFFVMTGLDSIYLIKKADIFLKNVFYFLFRLRFRELKEYFKFIISLLDLEKQKLLFYFALPIMKYFIFYSTFKHKEMRFLLPIIPFFNILIAYNFKFDKLIIFKILILIFSIYIGTKHQNYSTLKYLKSQKYDFRDIDFCVTSYCYPINMFTEHKTKQLSNNIDIKSFCLKRYIEFDDHSDYKTNLNDNFFMNCKKYLKKINNKYILIEDRTLNEGFYILENKYKIINFFEYRYGIYHILLKKI